MTASSTSSDNIGLFKSPFSIASTGVGVISLLASVVFLWTGYQESTLPVAGTELSILTGLVGFMLALLVAVTALFMAAFMEPGFDH